MEVFSSRQRTEEQFIIDYCRGVAAHGQFHRFYAFGLSKEDIPEYLPVEVLVPSATSWEELRAAFNSQTKHKSFKPWLKASRGIEFTDDLLVKAAMTLHSIPADFLALVEKCRTAALVSPRTSVVAAVGALSSLHRGARRPNLVRERARGRGLG